jgi:DNA repair ATPase RecN
MRLASIIVPNEACEQLYEADEIALALIRLVAGLAGEEDRHDAAFRVTVGMFRRTFAHNKALDDFTLEGLTFKPETLKSVEERIAELRELKRRM